jgi:hypothetical protein
LASIMPFQVSPISGNVIQKIIYCRNYFAVAK